MSQPPSNSVVSVHTEDANPDAPKFRLSAVAGHDTATVVVQAQTGTRVLRPGVGVRPGAGVRPNDSQVEPGGALVGDLLPGMTPYIASIRMTTGLRNAQPVANLGAVCGLDRCGAPGVMPLHVERTLSYGLAVHEQAIAGPDGDVTVNVYTLTEPEGWT